MILKIIIIIFCIFYFIFHNFFIEKLSLTFQELWIMRLIFIEIIAILTAIILSQIGVYHLD